LYAWDTLRNALGGDVQVESNYSSLFALNKSTLFLNSVSKDKLKLSTEIIEEEIKASAYFKLSLPFEFHFEPMGNKLKFGKQIVKSYGCGGFNHVLSEQVDILYYRNDADFAVILHPKDKNEEVILVMDKTNSFSSLADMIVSVEKKKKVDQEELRKDDSKYWRINFREEDQILIPVLSFNIAHDYMNIVGNRFAANHQIFTITKCFQSIAFHMDEKGAEVESAADLAAAASAEMPSKEIPYPKKMVFNKPFYIMLRRTNAVNPYLAMSVKNTELMVVQNIKK
jgi:hypothetical protein